MMNKTFKFLTLSLLLCLFAANCLQASPARKKEPNKGYRFTLFIYGCQDSVMYLGNYYAGGTYAFDTAILSPKGMFVFENKEAQLKPGLYFFVSQSGDYVEFAVYGNEKLDFHFDTEDPGWQNNMRVKGSKENEILFSYHQTNRKIYAQIDSAKRVSTDSAAFEAFRLKKIKQMDSIKENYISKYPNSMLALLMNATREPSVPTVDEHGKTLTNRERWNYFMDHFFDYTKLDDDALIRTPDMIFHQRLVNYLDKSLQNAPAETIIEYVDKLIEKAKPSKENFRYLVHTIAEKYLQSTIMSYDAVYVHMIKKYVETGMCDWMSPTTIDENVKRANTWEKILIGKPAPQLIMKDINGNFQSLYALKSKYTLLIFWSPTCGHCKTTIPDLYKRYAKYKDRCDISAFAVLSEPDEETRPKWHDFINKHGLDWINIDGGEANIDWHEVYDVVTTPQIFLLDKDKVILAKKLSAESFEEVIKIIEKIE
jgi:thiol-disulfide isomerase/thioredoxin